MKLVQKYYSRHTPSDLEEYSKLDDSTLKKLSRGQKLQLLENEIDKAERNSRKYETKKAIKHGLIGAGIVGATQSLRHKNTGLGLLAGGVGGAVVGSLRGSYLADKEGHNPEKVSKRVAEKLDKYARAHNQEDDYGFASTNSLRSRKAQRDSSEAKRNTTFLMIDSALR